ncbi:HNH endonuclease [Streptomyces thermocoprophilus]|uniref:HNH endonuclease n=1 Tax=Streptomyces thermocoprophilus TaxID=78356 RepID=A0ABV5VP03_9ACTN
MPVKLSPAERLALFTYWGEQCAWCGRPLFYNEYEVEHVLPKHLLSDAAERARVLAHHGLPADFDLLGIANLVPSCGPCNRTKGRRPPLHAPSITLLLDTARQRTPFIEESAARFLSRNRLDKALAVVEAVVGAGDLDTAVRERLEAAAEMISTAVRETTGQTLNNIHPALGSLHDRGRWKEVRPLSGEVAFVADGRTGGVIGTHWSWFCDRCGSNGPWNGDVCQTCGHRSVPDW